MKKKLAVIFILPLLLTGFHAALPEINQAEAARIGGGRSIGSKPGLNRSAPAPAPQRNIQQNQTNPGAAPLGARGGMMGGFLGPLLMGSLLGSLLFGGAFSGIGAIDLLVIGLLVFFIFRVIRRRPAAAPSGRTDRTDTRNMQGPGQDAWSHLRTNNTAASATGAQAQQFNLPPNFDVEKFLEGAKLMYARMQESWDKRDLNDISEFTTPGMYRIIREQAAEDPTPSRTDILTLNAQIYGFSQEADEENVAVYFDAMLREYADKGADYAREVWHFVRSKGGGSWKLDGIQQVE